MKREPTNTEQHLMTVIGFKSLEEMEDWFNQPTDPVVLARLRPVYPPDEPMPMVDDEPPSEST
jgi:hypothetical protein